MPAGGMKDPRRDARSRNGAARRRPDDGWPDADGIAPKRLPAEQLIAWALRRWGRKMALVTAFQAEGMVLLDLLDRARRARRSQSDLQGLRNLQGPDPAGAVGAAGEAPEGSLRVVTVDTGRLPDETHELIERVRSRYGVEVEMLVPEADRVEHLVRLGGPNLFYRSVEERLACCRVRKVEPLRRALADLDAWMTGLRRDQEPTRAAVEKIATDPEHGGIVKLSPLAGWTSDQVWAYIEAHDVPYHALYDRGYTSIGCAPCTRPTRPGEADRAGRWWWEQAQAKECGLHWTGGPRQAAVTEGTV